MILKGNAAGSKECPPCLSANTNHATGIDDCKGLVPPRVAEKEFSLSNLIEVLSWGAISPLLVFYQKEEYIEIMAVMFRWAIHMSKHITTVKTTPSPPVRDE